MTNTDHGMGGLQAFRDPQRGDDDIAVRASWRMDQAAEILGQALEDEEAAAGGEAGRWGRWRSARRDKRVYSPLFRHLPRRLRARRQT